MSKENAKQKFTDLLIETRIKKNMLKFQVADIFGWTAMYYGRFEKGDLIPNKSNIKKFADFIGLSVSEIEQILNDEKRG